MKIFIDLENNDVSIITDASEDAAPKINLEVSLTNPGETIYFENNFRFGLNIVDGPTMLYSATYPYGLEKYVSTDQELFSTEYIDNVKPNHEYQLIVWCINGTSIIEKAITFNTSNFGQPFPSWTFDEELSRWFAPKPMPEQGIDGVFYRWNETEKDWLQVTL